MIIIWFNLSPKRLIIITSIIIDITSCACFFSTKERKKKLWTHHSFWSWILEEDFSWERIIINIVNVIIIVCLEDKSSSLDLLFFSRIIITANALNNKKSGITFTRKKSWHDLTLLKDSLIQRRIHYVVDVVVV